MKLITVTLDDYGVKHPSWILMVKDKDVDATLDKIAKVDRHGSHRLEVMDFDSVEHVLGELEVFNKDMDE